MPDLNLGPVGWIVVGIIIVALATILYRILNAPMVGRVASINIKESPAAVGIDVGHDIVIYVQMSMEDVAKVRVGTKVRCKTSNRGYIYIRVPPTYYSHKCYRLIEWEILEGRAKA